MAGKHNVRTKDFYITLLMIVGTGLFITFILLGASGFFDCAGAN